jgi:hypothetical protein
MKNINPRIFLDNTINCPQCGKKMPEYKYRIGVKASDTRFVGKSETLFGTQNNYSTNYRIIENGTGRFCVRCHFIKYVFPVLIPTIIFVFTFIILKLIPKYENIVLSIMLISFFTGLIAFLIICFKFHNANNFNEYIIPKYIFLNLLIKHKGTTYSSKMFFVDKQ